MNPNDPDFEERLRMAANAVTASFFWSRKQLEDDGEVPAAFFGVSDDKIVAIRVNAGSEDFPQQVSEVYEEFKRHKVNEYTFVSLVEYVQVTLSVDDVVKNGLNSPEDLKKFFGSRPREYPDKIEGLQIVYGTKDYCFVSIWNVVRDEEGKFLSLEKPKDDKIHLSRNVGYVGELLMERPSVH